MIVLRIIDLPDGPELPLNGSARRALIGELERVGETLIAARLTEGEGAVIEDWVLEAFLTYANEETIEPLATLQPDTAHYLIDGRVTVALTAEDAAEAARDGRVVEPARVDLEAKGDALWLHWLAFAQEAATRGGITID